MLVSVGAVCGATAALEVSTIGPAEAEGVGASVPPVGVRVVAAVSPSITKQPVSQTVPYGSSVTFSASASGTPAPGVQWQLSVDHGARWSDVAGLTAPSFTRGPVTYFEQGWEVRAVFTNAAGSVTSSPASVTVTGLPPARPVVTRQPRSRTVAVGHNVTFAASARGRPSPSVQWQLSIDHGARWFDVAGLTTRSWTRGPVTFLEQGWQVRAVFTNSAGTATTSPATITVVPGPTSSGSPSGLAPGPVSGSSSPGPGQGGQGGTVADQSGQPAASLPFTGFPVEQSIVLAAALLACGIGLLTLSRRPSRPRRTTITALLLGDDPR